jgi:hypothetical protein
MDKNLVDHFDYLIEYCLEHGQSLKNHREFGNLQREMRTEIEQLQTKYIEILDKLTLTTKAVKSLNEAGCNLEERIHSIAGYLPKGGQDYIMCEEAIEFWLKAWIVGKETQVY